MLFISCQDCISRLITQVHEEMATLLRKFKQPEYEAFTGDNADADDGDGWTTVTSKGKKIKEARHVGSALVTSFC